MVAPGEVTGTTTVVLPPLTLLSGNVTSNGCTLGRQTLFKQDVKQAAAEVKKEQPVFTHGLHHLRHLSCHSPVHFMMYSDAAAAFISLHSDNTASLYNADGQKLTSIPHLPFMGLTATQISGCLVGWGPGPVLTLLDSELHLLDAAHDALDIRVCQVAEHPTELVTAGVGNVCVWSVMLMRCKVKIREGLQHSTFTHMALAPPRSGRPHRAFVVCGRVVTVIDLNAGKVLEHKMDICSRDITAMVFCSQHDCLIIATEDLSIKIWDPDWELRVTFVGHHGVVNSLFYCPPLRMLFSASLDFTFRCWNIEEGDVVECIHTEQKHPPLCIGGNRKGDTFFSFSNQGVDFWTIRALYTLHHELRGDDEGPLRQILVSPFPAPYPKRVLCLSGESNITLVAAETGTVLTYFKAKQRILCADYCLQKEILLALTETGTLLQANTLTNPITLMQEWEGRGQGPWHQRDNVTAHDARNLPIPGQACCLVLYSCLAEKQAALEDWRSLQDRRGWVHRKKAALDDAKNKFLIILGQSGGCVSVVQMHDGKVLCRTAAHHGQRVTAVQVYPENGYLLSTGEDMNVVVWRVSPYVQECLSQQLSLRCDQPLAYLAALGPHLALAFQERNSGTYNLMHFNTDNRSSHPTKDGHLDPFTGLCACPDLDIFVSSSLDGTVCVWNEESQLLVSLQLNAVPECLTSGGFGGELFLGIKGGLYRMNCAEFLPHNYQQMLLYTYSPEPVPDFPIIEDTEKRIKNASPDKDEEEDDMWRQEENEGLVTSDKDVAALLEGSVKCKKGKPPSTKNTKKEAFDRYMKIIYRLPPRIEIDLGEAFDLSKLPIYPEPCDVKPRKLPELKEEVVPEPKLNIPVIEEKKTKKKRRKTSKPKTLMKVKPRPVVIPQKPIIVEKDEEPPKISPVEQPKPKTPSPPPPPPTPPPRFPRAPPPPPQREPSPEMLSFLKQFAEAVWFKDLYPNTRCIPSSLSPDDFSLQLLGCLDTCSTASKMDILIALQALHSQELLQNTDKLYQGLIDLLTNFVGPHMSFLEQALLVDILNLLMCLKPASCDLGKKLLALLTFKKLGLRETVLQMLNRLGVNEAEQWLMPELESWDSGLQDGDIWKSLHDKADRWLELWMAKYKEHDRYLFLRSTEKWKTRSFSTADVLNYFCSIRKDEHRKAQRAIPADRKNTVVLPPYDCSQPILRLGETYTMARVSRPPGLTLPPLRNRPSLTRFPNFIILPFSRVTLFPFRIYSDEDWVRVSTRRYFFLRQSYVDYYR